MKDDHGDGGAGARDEVRWSLITVSFNSADALREHWAAPLPEGVEWLVVDNDSSDRSVDVARSLGARVLALDENLGFGAANNVGFRAASGEYIAFVNPDVTIDFDSLPILEAAVLGGGGLVSPQLTFDGGSLQPNGRLAPSFSNKVFSRLGRRGTIDRYHVYAGAGERIYVAWFIGAAVVAARADFARLGTHGPWDERFFVYYEDSDLGLRAWRAGLTVRVIGDAKWEHSWSRDTMRMRLRPWMLEFASMAKFYSRYPDLIIGSGRSGFRPHHGRWGTAEERTPDRHEPVDISLCLTVLDEAATIATFLTAVERQTLKPKAVIVADGGSSDGTLEILRAWSPPPGTRLVVIEAPGANISEGRNRAIREADTEWVAVSDAGTDLMPDWLERLSDEMQHGVSVVSGFFEPQAGSVVASTIGAVITPLVSEIEPRTFLPSSRSVAFRRQAWADAGGYPEWLDYCEDLIFDLQVKRNGASFAFADAAIVRWDARPTLRAFGRQYYRYARGDGKAGLFPRRHVVRYLAYTVGAALIAIGWRRRSGWAMAALGAGGAAYLAKFVRRVARRRGTVVRNPIAAFLLTPVVVVVGDIAKMLGYPVGLVWRLRQRWGRG